eukprot:182676-Rhodomonas_salina.1
MDTAVGYKTISRWSRALLSWVIIGEPYPGPLHELDSHPLSDFNEAIAEPLELSVPPPEITATASTSRSQNDGPLKQNDPGPLIPLCKAFRNVGAPYV